MNKLSRTKIFLTLSALLVFTAISFTGCEKSIDTTGFNTGTTAVEFIDFSVNGVPYSHTYAIDSLLHIVANNGPTLYDMISGYNPGSSLQTSILYLYGNTNPGDSKPLYTFNSSIIAEPTLTVLSPPMLIHFTEYGATGQYISGNFSGAFKGAAPNNTIYNIVCSFRIRRH